MIRLVFLAVLAWTAQQAQAERVNASRLYDRMLTSYFSHEQLVRAQ